MGCQTYTVTRGTESVASLVSGMSLFLVFGLDVFFDFLGAGWVVSTELESVATGALMESEMVTTSVVGDGITNVFLVAGGALRARLDPVLVVGLVEIVCVSFSSSDGFFVFGFGVFFFFFGFSETMGGGDSFGDSMTAPTRSGFSVGGRGASSSAVGGESGTYSSDWSSGTAWVDSM